MSLQRFGTRHINSTAFCGKEKQWLRKGMNTHAGSLRQFRAGSQGPPSGSFILGKDTGPCHPLLEKGRGFCSSLGVGHQYRAPNEPVTTCGGHATQSAFSSFPLSFSNSLSFSYFLSSLLLLGCLSNSLAWFAKH